MNINIENYYTARKNVFERFNESSTITKIVFSLTHLVKYICFTIQK